MHVEQNEGKILCAEQIERFVALVGAGDKVAGVLEQQGRDATVGFVIVDQQNRQVGSWCVELLHRIDEPLGLGKAGVNGIDDLFWPGSPVECVGVTLTECAERIEG